MRMLISTLVILAALPSAALGQAAAEHRGQGYVFFAPGGLSAGGDTLGTIHFGGGGEALLAKGFGVGGELGYIAPRQSFSDGLGVASFDPSYHFLPAFGKSKLAPFVEGGYTLMFRSGSLNLVNFGGGVHYWFRERVGLRLEFRDHVHLTHGFTGHYWGFRIGLAFR